MSRQLCRLCNRPVGQNVILKYHSMPSSAQGFLDEQELVNDHGSQLVVCQCKSCGLVQVKGEPVAYYRDVIRATSVSQEMKEYRQSQFGKWIKKYHLTGKKIVEIGCGRGEYMKIMADFPVKLYGIEHKKESVVYDRKSGLSVSEAFIENADEMIEYGPYDGFYILNFLEHIPYPNQFLQGICNNLTDSGIGLVEVPNFNMILEKKLFSEFIADHLMYFTKDTLRLILECNGFEVLEVNELWYDYIISAVVRKKKPIDIVPLKNQKDLITNQVWEYIDRVKVKGGEVAIWGAGHQSMAVLSITEIYKEISCIIDSASFKQNKYTPATHIKIVKPDILTEGNITDVLIIAGGFSDEIAHILKDKYPNIQRAILRDNGVENC